LSRTAFSFADVTILPKPQYLIHGHLPKGAQNLYFGSYAAGKTFFALGQACSIGYGVRYYGSEVAQGRVVYICSEGKSGLARRYKAWLMHHHIALDDPRCQNIKFICDSFNLSLESEVDELVELCRNAFDGTPPDLVVIDTLARNIGTGENENMQSFVDACDEIQQRLAVGEERCTLIMVHHSGKDVSRGPRGGSQLPGAVDVIRELHGLKEGNTTVAVQITTLKMKDGPAMAPLVLDFQLIDLSDDPDDTSLVLVPSQRRPGEPDDTSKKNLLHNADKLWESIPMPDQPGKSKKAIEEDAQGRLAMLDQPRLSQREVRSVWAFLDANHLLARDHPENATRAKINRATSGAILWFERWDDWTYSVQSGHSVH
jgi:putative DNA primase/helicase